MEKETTAILTKTALDYKAYLLKSVDIYNYICDTDESKDYINWGRVYCLVVDMFNNLIFAPNGSIEHSTKLYTPNIYKRLVSKSSGFMPPSNVVYFEFEKELGEGVIDMERTNQTIHTTGMVYVRMLKTHKLKSRHLKYIRFIHPVVIHRNGYNRLVRNVVMVNSTDENISKYNGLAGMIISNETSNTVSVYIPAVNITINDKNKNNFTYVIKYGKYSIPSIYATVINNPYHRGRTVEVVDVAQASENIVRTKLDNKIFDVSVFDLIYDIDYMKKVMTITKKEDNPSFMKRKNRLEYADYKKANENSVYREELSSEIFNKLIKEFGLIYENQDIHVNFLSKQLKIILEKYKNIKKETYAYILFCIGYFVLIHNDNYWLYDRLVLDVSEETKRCEENLTTNSLSSIPYIACVVNKLDFFNNKLNNLDIEKSLIEVMDILTTQEGMKPITLTPAERIRYADNRKETLQKRILSKLKVIKNSKDTKMLEDALNMLSMKDVSANDMSILEKLIKQIKI